MKNSISVIGCRAFPSEFEGTSGIESYTESVVKNLVKKSEGLSFTFYTKVSYQKKVHQNKIKNVSVRPLFSLPLKVFETVIYSLLASIYCAFDSSSVVWYHGVGPGIFCFIPKIFGKKIALTIHSLDWERDKWSKLEKKLFYFFASFAVSQSDELFCVSEHLMTFVKRYSGKKATLVSAGIELSTKTQNSKYLSKYALKKNHYLLFLGRVVPEKRIEWLIEKFLRVQNNFPDLKLVISGGHGNMPEYEKKLKEKFRSKNIIWTGYVFGEEKKSLLKFCRSFVLPSSLEGMPISFIEALELSVPCLISKKFSGQFFRLGNVMTFEDKKSFDKALLNICKTGIKKFKYSKAEIAIINRNNWGNTTDCYLKYFLAI